MENKLSYIVPAAATIVAAIISAVALFIVSEVKERDLGPLKDGQKVCVVAKTGVWHNVTIVPKAWTVSMCSGLNKQLNGDAFRIGCAFKDKYVINEVNDPGIPNENCGW